mmetsp:Transcript_126600/g.364147  ORF Transcript_126600/g.364147 Transcript_126600/m.364147 type:complete len:517 (+) Transcript_126600:106-1656(+)
MSTVSKDELAKHSKEGDLWMAIDGDVYDVSKFARLHPGGSQILEQFGGKDATVEFYEMHRKDVLLKYQRLKVGTLEGAKQTASVPGEITKIPFYELPAFQGQNSPYYRESHRNLVQAVRAFVQTELEPIAEAADLAGDYPDRELQEKLGMSGMMAISMGPGPWLKFVGMLGIKIPGNVDPDDFDYFHEMLAHLEVARLGRPGFVDSLGAGWGISAPAVFHFCNDEVRKTVGAQLLMGKKWSALAISEPFAGSDVAALRATAEKTPDGKHYIVNGIKKWITEGMYADYFVTAVRTGKTGTPKDMSMLLVERGPGVETKQIKTTYSTCCGTAMVIMNNVKVPVENLMGKEGRGFLQIMYNFNHERWLIAVNLIGQARAAVADTFMWARQRKIFGKTLIEQPVIRNKLASSAAALESLTAMLETVTYDMCKTKGGSVGERLAGPIALLKYQTTRSSWKIADECVQVFGGRGITRTGMGAKAEGFKNYVKYAAVYGGSEEIMADLSVRMAMRQFPKEAKL